MWTPPQILSDPSLEYYYSPDSLSIAGSVWPTWAPVVSNFVYDKSGKSGLRNMTAYNANRDGTLMFSDPSDPHLPIIGPGESGSGFSVTFVWQEYQWIVWGDRLGLQAQHSFPIEWNTTLYPDLPAGTGSTFTARIAYVPNGPSNIAPFTPGSDGVGGPDLSLISTWARSFGIGNYGVQLGFVPGTGQLYYWVGTDNLVPDLRWFGPICAPYQLFTFTNVVEKISARGAPNIWRRSIYIDDALTYQVEGGSIPISHGGTSLSFGIGMSDDIRNSHGRGVIDSVAYFSSPKSPPKKIKTIASWGMIAS
jgi:hypothetical protein